MMSSGKEVTILPGTLEEEPNSGACLLHLPHVSALAQAFHSASIKTPSKGLLLFNMHRLDRSMLVVCEVPTRSKYVCHCKILDDSIFSIYCNETVSGVWFSPSDYNMPEPWS